MEAQVICPESQGGWVEVYRLREGGEVEMVRPEGHTDEAKRLREAARQQGPSFSQYLWWPRPNGRRMTQLLRAPGCTSQA